VQVRLIPECVHRVAPVQEAWSKWMLALTRTAKLVLQLGRRKTTEGVIHLDSDSGGAGGTPLL
jgi:hypothetical protein